MLKNDKMFQANVQIFTLEIHTFINNHVHM